MRLDVSGVRPAAGKAGVLVRVIREKLHNRKIVANRKNDP
jgi:hypothetical protein